jgi:hypothetical protein
MLDCEGHILGSVGGALSLLSVGTAEGIFVFDAVKLVRPSRAWRSLMLLLGDASVTKIVWDGRQDFLEIWDSYGVALDGVLDLQLAEVVSRSACRGETEANRLERLSTSFFSRSAVFGHVEQYSAIHAVIGMQKCLDENNLGKSIKKDGEHFFKAVIIPFLLMTWPSKRKLLPCIELKAALFGWNDLSLQNLFNTPQTTSTLSLSSSSTSWKNNGSPRLDFLIFSSSQNVTSRCIRTKAGQRTVTSFVEVLCYRWTF